MRCATAQAPNPGALPGQPTVVYPAGYTARWLDDREFVYGPPLLQFDVAAYLSATAPHLSPFAETITHWCGFYSISPKVALAILESQTRAVSVGAPDAIANPTAGLIDGAGFAAQFQNLVARLYRDFYAHRAATAAPGPAAMTAATFALVGVYRGSNSVEAFAPRVADARTRFVEAYGRLFPSDPQVATASAGATPPATLLQLPWKQGQSWTFNGVHATDGGTGVMSSIDFARTTLPWGADTSSDFVVAAHAGTVTVFSSCNVRVTSATGWETNYYHMDNLVVWTGMQVSANQTLGVYADNLPDALCQGGGSTGPHVHFSLLLDGFFASLDGVALSGFVVHPGRFSYDADPSYMWLEKNGTKYYVPGPIVSTASNPGTLSIDDFTLSEGHAGTKGARFLVKLAAPIDATVTVQYTAINVTAMSTAPGTSYPSTAPMTIPSAGNAVPYPSTITVPAGLPPITKLAVRLTGFSHGFPGDVDVLLVGPTGQAVMLMSDVGSGVGVSGLTLTFDDTASTSLTITALSSGTYRPTNLEDNEGTDVFGSPAPAVVPASTLSAFNGTNAAGQWRLFVRDDFDGFSGSISGGWSLIVSTQPGDFVPVSGTLTFPPGSTSQTITVPVNGDTLPEIDEMFYVMLSSPTNAAFFDSQGQATIVDDDSFTNASLSGVPVKAAHVSELRTIINKLRAGRGLGNFAFTDPVLTPGVTRARAAHVLELRTALASVYAAAGTAAPAYTDANITPEATFIRAVHILELRQRVAGAP